MRKDRNHYVPDLQLLSSLTEANYARLNRLLPELEVGQSFRFRLSSGDHPELKVAITVEEVHKYTSMLVIEQCNAAHNWVNPPVMQVRMYHDAQMAEVTGYQKQRVVDGRFEYPNAKMHQPDEKTRLNGFLADWLEHCVRFGCVEAVPVSSATVKNR